MMGDMERKGLSSCLKGHCFGSHEATRDSSITMYMYTHYRNMLKGPLGASTDREENIRIHASEKGSSLGHRDISYFCSFCKMEFWSSQALEGHMNVH